EEDEEQDEDDDDEEEEHPGADRPEVTLPPRNRLSIVHCPGYEAGEILKVVGQTMDLLIL
nr:hypothetical protein [Tanacetum cinerariifolium]